MIKSGAHVCQLCNKYVHALPQCSISFEDAEESYGQRRVCIMCKDNVQNIKDILASREVENWRGQTKSNKNNALYLGKNPHKIIDALTCKKVAKIPILKNSNNTSLKSLKIQNENYTLAKNYTLVHLTVISKYYLQQNMTYIIFFNIWMK